MREWEKLKQKQKNENVSNEIKTNFAGKKEEKCKFESNRWCYYSGNVYTVEPFQPKRQNVYLNLCISIDFQYNSVRKNKMNEHLSYFFLAK